MVCERWVGDRDRQLYWPNSTSFSSWLGCSTVGHWGPKALSLQACSHALASYLQLTQTICSLIISFFNAYLLPLFFRLFTQVYLLIDSSVEGQYITITGTTTSVQSCTEGVLHILQNSRIGVSSSLDGLVAYPGHLLGVSYPSAEMQSAYSMATANWNGVSFVTTILT